MSALDVAKLELRDLREEDVPIILRYWFHSPPGYVEAMGVDLAKLPSEEGMEQNIRQRIRDNRDRPQSKMTALAIVYEGRMIGVHTLFPVEEGKFAVFHAHLFASEMRGKGLGRLSYPRAALLFMKRFDLPRILFKTPLQNPGAVKVKERLGIRCIGEEQVVDAGILRDGTLTKVFELTREEAEALVKGD